MPFLLSDNRLHGGLGEPYSSQNEAIFIFLPEGGAPASHISKEFECVENCSIVLEIVTFIYQLPQIHM
jgi:hypothetical protein